MVGGSKVHRGLRIHGGHGDSSSRRLAVVCIAIGLGDLVPVDPLRAVLLWDAHLNAVLVDALYHPSISLERPSSDSDRLPYLQLLLLPPSEPTSRCLRGRFEVPAGVLDVRCHHHTVVHSLHSHAPSLIELGTEEENEIPEYMLDFTAAALHKK